MTTAKLLRGHFVFFNCTEPLILFLLDYLDVRGLFVDCRHVLRCTLNPLMHTVSKKSAVIFILHRDENYSGFCVFCADVPNCIFTV